MVRVLQDRYGLAPRENAGARGVDDPDQEINEPEQAGFAW
jgi:hypothetical protein